MNFNYDVCFQTSGILSFLVKINIHCNIKMMQYLYVKNNIVFINYIAKTHRAFKYDNNRITLFMWYIVCCATHAVQHNIEESSFQNLLLLRLPFLRYKREEEIEAGDSVFKNSAIYKKTNVAETFHETEYVTKKLP